MNTKHSTAPTSRRFALLLLIVNACVHSVVVAAPKRDVKTPQQKRARSFEFVSENDKAMNAAIRRAKGSIGKFIKALRSPTKSQNHFAVKKAFHQGEDVEFIWIRDITYDGKRFRGQVNNVPEMVTKVKLNDTVLVTPHEVSDWMYLDRGKVVGGYTMRVLYDQLSPGEKAKFRMQSGLQF